MASKEGRNVKKINIVFLIMAIIALPLSPIYFGFVVFMYLLVLIAYKIAKRERKNQIEIITEAIIEAEKKMKSKEP